MSYISLRVKRKIQEAKEKQLKELNLSHEDLTQIPEEVLELESLEKLDLSGNQIKAVPQELNRLKNIKILDLRGNSLEEVADLAGLSLDFEVYQKFKNNISSQNISGLRIKIDTLNLPLEVFNLPNLTFLDLRFNRFKKLPESITKLINLTGLNLSGNQLT